ncbi:ThiF family adenylyltransferase [Streptomyces sp. CA-294286]|uniref:ThiF family adenylyltransferase n=1 Tax=Streptomyces sp. CA-294286 TaxID=3240070 RepID=UPI003D8A465C
MDSHPRVKPALRRAWRDRQSVQFGVTAAHAVVVGPVDTATGSLLSLLDGTRGMPLLREEARALGLPDGRVDTVVARLAGAGLIDDVTAGGAAADALRRRTAEADRLRPDLASLSVVSPEPGGGARRLAARRAARVQVRGAGRVGATVASLLAASGVGHVDVLDGGCVEPWDVAPGGVPAESVGTRRATAARQTVRRWAPGRAPRAGSGAGPTREGTGTGREGSGTGREGTGTGREVSGTGPPVGARSLGGGGAASGAAGQDGGGERCGGGGALRLVVVAPRDGLEAYVPDPAVAEGWVASRIPHLYAGVLEATGVVGPLVLPGGSACAGCMARARTEADRQWPRMLAQWRSGRRADVGACDVALATAVAALAAAHALAFLDGELPSSTGTRWEAALPLLDWRAERVAAHAECYCGAGGEHPGGVERDVPSGGLKPHVTMAG